MPLALAAVLLLLASLALLYHVGVRALIAPRFERTAVTPADSGLPFDDVYFPTTDGLRLHAWFVPAPSPRGTVIFCHGHSGTPAPDLQYVPGFRERGYNVLLIDFRAHGQSEGRFTSLQYFERRDLAAAIHYLEGRGIGRVGLLGFSMGAAASMSGAGDLRQVAAVVADCGYAELWRVVVEGACERGVPRLLAWGLSPLVVLLASLRLGVPLWTADPLRHVGRISPRPLLIIAGGRDQYIPPSEARRLYAAAGEPKELWIVPEGGHRAVDRVDPVMYNARVLGFFDRWLSRA